jgi:serine/threonine-protein kinase
VRKIDPAGTITTVAGTGRFKGYATADDVPLRLRVAGDGGPATKARLTPIDVAVDRAGRLYASEFHTGLVHKVDRDGIITTVAGSRGSPRRADRSPATSSPSCCATPIVRPLAPPHARPRLRAHPPL